MNQATYSPEDNKLRLYVGRVPRDEYEKLRAEGWTSTPKQNCQFVAHWTPARRDTALEYAGIIEDEDQGPAERAADRAERFAGYLEKRTNEATGRADRYDATPSAHGYQSHARAERSAAKHDRIASRACDAWSKAEYWQQRTAGVIIHALHLSTPAVRMGRIKTLETELRGFMARWKGQEMTQSAQDWVDHLNLRLAYENQMCEAAGGRAALVEMVAGGFIGTRQIRKVVKSPVTGLVVSVEVMGTTSGFTRESGYKEYSTRAVPVLCNIERLGADAYRPPTDEELTAFKASMKAEKDAKPKVEKPPLINPTDEEAERLQALWNARALAEHCESHLRQYGNDYAAEFKPSTVCRIAQAIYSVNSKGGYARAETKNIYGNATQEPRERFYDYAKQAEEIKARGPVVCQLRITSGDGSHYGAKRVIVLTDKPQKPLPAAVWEKPFALETVNA